MSDRSSKHVISYPRAPGRGQMMIAVDPDELRALRDEIAALRRDIKTVHGDCANHAAKVCPHIRTLGHGPLRWIEPSAVVAAIVGGPATEKDFEIKIGTRKVIGHLKFVWSFDPRRYVRRA